MAITLAMLLEYSPCCSSRYTTNTNNATNNTNTTVFLGSLPDGILFMQFAIGALAMRGAGCTINDMWDRYRSLNY